MKRNPITFLGLLLALPLSAQQGDRKGHDNMDPVVPQEAIPPAPVLSVDEALASFEIADGFVIEPFATEPMVDRPVDFRFDANGRMWVVEMIGYMPNLDGEGEETPQGRISVLEDTDNDGQADKRTVFADNILLPRAIALVEDGLLIGDEHHLYFCGRDGVERTSELVVVDEDFAPTGNVEHKTNSLLPHLNNWLYCAKSDARFRWQDGKLKKDTTQFRGQWGISMDDFGRLYHNNNSTIVRGDRLLPDILESYPSAKLKPDTSTRLGNNKLYPIRVTPGANRAYIAKANGYDKDTLDPETYKLIEATGAAGLAVYRGDQFPSEWQNVSFTTESVANLVKAVRIHADGLELSGEPVYEDKEFLASTDERFRPVNLHTGPDGCLYLADIYHGLIQHKTYMTSYLREQYASRDLDKPERGVGRIYRIRYEGKPRGPQPKMQDAPSAELVKHLAHPNGWWRDTAQRLLVERNDAGVVAELKEGLRNHPNEIARIHMLWTLQGMGELAQEDYAVVLDRKTAESLRIHALAAAVASPQVSVASLISDEDKTDPSATYPYVIRHLASLPSAPSLLEELTLKPTFAAEAAAAGLLAQGLTEFPPTKSKLDRYLENYKRNNATKPAEERLSGEHLASFQRGKEVYMTKAACVGCHGADGAGMPNLGPPLDESEWVTDSPERLTKILLHGLQGPIKVNGKVYKPAAFMPGLAQNPSITDRDLADIMTYIRAEWSNDAPLVTEEEVKATREATSDRLGRVYKVEEL
ncbi:MAG: c-type cytochrome [Verrucomicrobiota bacterium JB023]|nr:c-type cytochrome [Verrucomicrobiota bacterium JB023]